MPFVTAASALAAACHAGTLRTLRLRSGTFYGQQT
jgi:hypothetical protein